MTRIRSRSVITQRCPVRDERLRAFFVKGSSLALNDSLKSRLLPDIWLDVEERDGCGELDEG